MFMKESMPSMYLHLLNYPKEDKLTECLCCGRQYYTAPLHELYGVCGIECFAIEYHMPFELTKKFRDYLRNKLYLSNLNFNSFRSD